MKIFPHWRVICFTCLTLSLAACQSPPTQFVPIEVTQPQQAKAWELHGKMLLTLPEDKISSQLYWAHQPQKDEMQLNTVLGINLLTLQITPEQTELTVEGKSYQDADPQALLQRLTGWQIPVKQLPLWMTGQFEGLTVLTRDPQHRPLLLTNSLSHTPSHTTSNAMRPSTSDSWLIRIKSWQSEHPSLPKLIELEHQALKIKLQINQWQALAPLP